MFHNIFTGCIITVSAKGDMRRRGAVAKCASSADLQQVGTCLWQVDLSRDMLLACRLEISILIQPHAGIVLEFLYFELV